MAILRHAAALARAGSRFPRVSAPARRLATAHPPTSPFAALDTFARRHIGPDNHEEEKMLSQLGYKSMDAFVQDAVPQHIRVPETTVSDESIPSVSERELYQRAKVLADENKLLKSYIGMGYHNAVTPPVILRNVSLPLDNQLQKNCTHPILPQIVENPAWYTQYTPYQPEIAQGCHFCIR
jgi:glycine dehydrogenase